MELKQKQVLIMLWILGTLNACGQWPIDLISQKSILFRVYRRILVPTIFPVNIWRTYLFEIKHRWAKWLISDPSPKGTRRISDLMIRLQITQISDPMNPSPEWIWSITDLKMDLLEKNVTDQKSWSGFSQRNALLNCHSRFHLSLYHPLLIYLVLFFCLFLLLLFFAAFVVVIVWLFFCLFVLFCFLFLTLKPFLNSAVYFT